LAQQTGRPEWQPGLRRLVAYGLLEKVGESTRGGRRAYYRMPDRPGVEEALKKIPTVTADETSTGVVTRAGRLVRGEPPRRATMAPLLGGDLLSNLHPCVQEVARPLFAAGESRGGRIRSFQGDRTARARVVDR